MSQTEELCCLVSNNPTNTKKIQHRNFKKIGFSSAGRGRGKSVTKPV